MNVIKYILLAMTMVGALQAENPKSSWFDQMRTHSKDALEKGKSILEKGSREYRCFMRRQMSPKEQFEAATDPEAYGTKAFSDCFHECKQIKNVDDLATVARVYAHVYALPLVGIGLLCAVPLPKALLYFAAISVVAFATKQVMRSK